MIDIAKSKALVIPVSFTQNEKDLFQSIEEHCKYIKKSDWMKQAAAEKIARESQTTLTTDPQMINYDNLLDSFNK